MKKIVLGMCLLVLFTANAFSDVRFETPKPTATPKQAKALDTRLYIRISSDTKEARLVIPKSQLQQLRAELEQLDDSNSANSFNFTRTQTIVSGLFISLAFVFGGVWFARSRKIETKTGKSLVAGVVLFLSGAFATIAFANVGPPPDARSITGKIFSDAVHQYSQASGNIKLEISDADNGIQLIVPREGQKERRSDE